MFKLCAPRDPYTESMEAIRPALSPAPAPRPSAASPQQPVDRVELGRASDDVVPPRLAEALRRSGRVYYDAGPDGKEQRRYYGNLLNEAGNLNPQKLFFRLSELVEETHKQPRSYDPDQYLYSWVDLRPNLRLNCIYAPNATEGIAVRGKPDDFNEKVATGRTRRGREVFGNRSVYTQAQEWAKALSSGPTNALQLAQKIAEIETKSYFNCEHVVPRIWFGDQAPMRGDLHHLFTANQETNGNRSSRRLVDFPEYDGSDGKGLAPYKDNRYEPAAGKGAVARATLYFLLRYPRKVGDDPREIRPEDLATLLQWNREYPVTLYERHRNAAIQELQGNRNPFIDHPEWADKIDFTQGLQKPRPEGMQPPRQTQQNGRPQQPKRNQKPKPQERFRPQGSQRNRPKRRWRR